MKIEDRHLAVHMEDVKFSYYSGKKVFDHIHLSANPGEIVALIGPSREGKTTMIRILLGLLNPQSGTYYLEDKKHQKIQICSDTRRYFSYVPQGNTMFSGTIADNMRMIAPEASDDEIWEVLKVACAKDFVERLPDGIYSKIGEKGGGFSEGQAQRLSIARALLKRAPIVVLDEATSALDIQIEYEVLRNIMNYVKNCTCIVTTHRPSVLEMCHKVYRISQTKVTEVEGQ